jgi:hypothetical protein
MERIVDIVVLSTWKCNTTAVCTLLQQLARSSFAGGLGLALTLTLTSFYPHISTILQDI